MSRTLHSIMFGVWAMTREGAMANMPTVLQLLRGEQPKLSKGQLKQLREQGAPRMHDGSAIVLNDENMGTATANDVVPEADKKVLILPIKGAILKDGDWCTYGMADYCNWLAKADRDSSIVGVVLDIDSPGGQATGMTMMVDQLQRMKKPVVSIIRHGAAASAAYGIASATREIWAAGDTDMFGSIGTYLTIADWYGYLLTEGLKMIDVYATKSTDKNRTWIDATKADPENPNDPHLTKLRVEFIDPFNESFQAIVKKGRPNMVSTEEKWNTGKLFFANDAKKLGLIDGFNTMEGVVNRVRDLAKADNPSSNGNPKNDATTPTTMKMTERIASLVAGLKNMFSGADEVNSTTIGMANAALKAEGFEGMVLIESARIAAVENAEATIAEAKTAVTTAEGATASLQTRFDEQAALLATATTDLATATASVTTLSTDLASANSKVTETAALLETANTTIAAHVTEIAELKQEEAPDNQPASAKNAKGDKDPSHTSPATEEVNNFYAEIKKEI